MTMIGLNDFWKKVYRCKHKLSTEYYREWPCETLFCIVHEVHCLKCGVYITHCDCYANDTMSGWPSKRWEHYNAGNRRQIKKVV